MTLYNFTLNTTEYNKDIIKSKLYTTKKAGYIILNNTDNKDTLTVNDYNIDNLNCSGLYNSVILMPDININMIISFSPQTEVLFNSFMLSYPTITPNICVNELIEGTLIHLFYDFRINSWEIATKNAIGGDYWFYKTNYDLPNFAYANNKYNYPNYQTQLTFRNMFIEAITQTRCDDCDSDLNNIECFKAFDKSKSYSFVLQHPQNHIILPIQTPTLYLVGVYGISLLNTVTYISPVDYEKWDCFTKSSVSNIIKFPKKYNQYNLTYEDYTNKYCSGVSPVNLLPFIPGLIFTDTNNGMRTVITNPIYDTMKELRGNHPNLQYHYFTLLKNNTITLFLKYFPMYKSLFNHFNNEYNQLITKVHQCYYKHYVLKDYKNVVSGIYRTHIYKIHHQIFIPSKIMINKME